MYRKEQATIAYNDDADTVAAKLNALEAVSSDSVTVSRTGRRSCLGRPGRVTGRWR